MAFAERVIPPIPPFVTDFQYGTLAARPAFGNLNTYYWATDVFNLYRDTGLAWELAASGYYYPYLLPPIGQTINGDFITTTFSSVADRYYCTPFNVKFPLQVTEIGVYHGLVAGGNLRYGIHDVDGNLLPDTLVAQTGVIAPIGAPNSYRWEAPIGAPITLIPGIYWVGAICDENYVGGVSGMQFKGSANIVGGANNSWNPDGLDARYREDAGAFVIPDPMTEVADSNRNMLSVILRCQAIA